MEAGYTRNIRNGSEYDHLFPKATGRDITILKTAGVEDTIALIRKSVRETLEDTRRVAPLLKGSNLYDTCRRIWNFVYHHIQYKKDRPGVEQVRRPRRAWDNRFSGVDCDCYSEFISSILLNIKIPHKLRIAVYNPSVGYQHIYPIVPVDGDLDNGLDNRSGYIVIDCVKDKFDDEQPYLKIKDYNMRLDLLDGIDGEPPSNVAMVIYPSSMSSDARELAALYEEELGSGFSDWWGRVTNPNGLKRTVQKAANDLNEGMHFLNRFANPATVLLRNGFLASMKWNLMNVAGRVRYAYLTDEEARRKGLDMNMLNNLRLIKDKVETIYWQAGGMKENLKKAILTGKGNKDRSIPLDGLSGFGAVYADKDEFEVLNRPMNGMGELGEPITLASIAAAAAAVGAVALSLKQVKGLFGNKDSKEEKDMNTDHPDGSDGKGSAEDANKAIIDANTGQNSSDPSSGSGSQVQTGSQGSSADLALSKNNGGANNPAVVPQSEGNKQDPKTQEGFFTKAGAWIKAHPFQTVIIGGAITGAGVLLLQSHRVHIHPQEHLTGLPQPPQNKAQRKNGKKRGRKKGGKPKAAKTRKNSVRKEKLQLIKL